MGSSSGLTCHQRTRSRVFLSFSRPCFSECLNASVLSVVRLVNHVLLLQLTLAMQWACYLVTCYLQLCSYECTNRHLV